MTAAFKLERTARGRLVLTLADGTTHEGVQPVRAFPLSAPTEFLALVSTLGRELLAIDHLDDVPEPARSLILEELAPREFMPRILAIESVSTFATPSVWEVRTDRGKTSMTLKAEEDIRRIDRGRLLINDSHGLQLMIDDPAALDARSRRFLERCL